MDLRSVLRLLIIGAFFSTNLQMKPLTVQAESLPMLRFEIVTSEGDVLPNQPFVLRPFISDVELRSRMLNAAELPIIGSGKTDDTGSAEIAISPLARTVAPVESGYSIELKSRKWFVTESTVITPQQEKVTVRADVIPVIVVPGIMGSFLDIGNTNYWPGLPLQDKLPLHDIDNPAIRATDVVREITGAYIVYTKLLIKLKSAGYREYLRPSSEKPAWTAQERCEEAERLITAGNRAKKDTTLFTFGYDWRQSTQKSAEVLKNLVSCVRRIHGGKVNLVGHSMGGLVIKQYILQGQSSADTVKSVTTFNTPYLGAVTAIKILGNGEYGSVNYFLKADKLKMLARVIPGAIELLPSNLYLSQTPHFFRISGSYMNSQEQYWNELANEFGDRAKQYKLADEVGRDDLDSVTALTKDIDYLIQFSSNTSAKLNEPTVARVTKTSKGDWVPTTGTGDGTVNEFSLTRRKADVNWNPKSIPDRRTVFMIGYCNLGIDHSAIVNNDSALNALIGFLSAASFSPTNTYCVDGVSVNATDETLIAITDMQPADYVVPTSENWPELKWKLDPRSAELASVKAFYLEVKADDGRPWSGAAVYECVTKAADGSGVYAKPSVDFMRANQGSFVWRVRPSTVGMADKESCKAANRGQTTGWSTERHFSSFGLVVRSPASDKAIGLPMSFEAESLQTTWARVVTNGQVVAPEVAFYRFRLHKSGSPTLSYCTTNPNIDATTQPGGVLQDGVLQEGFFRRILKMSGVYTYQYEAFPKGTAFLAPDKCDKYSSTNLVWRSIPRSIDIRVKPDIIAPADGVVTSDGTWPTLRWQPAGNLGSAPFGYRIQVSRTRDFSRDIIVNECTTDTSYTPTNPGWMAEHYGTLYWRINYVTQNWTDKSACGRYKSYVSGAESVTRSFTSRPGIVLTEPTTGFVSTTGKIPVLRWRDGAYGAARNGYRIEISRTGTGVSKIVNECVRTASYSPTAAWWSHAQMGEYTWRVNYVRESWSTQAQCLSQSLDDNLWSESRSFQNPAVNKAASLTSPADGYAEPSGLWPLLSWNPAAGELGQYGYKIQVSRDRSFSTSALVVNECRTTNSYVPTSEDWARSTHGTFFWRINYLTQAWDGTKSTCEPIYIHPAFWSLSRSFKTAIPNNPITLVSPSSGISTSNGLWPTLQWDNGLYMTAPHGYRLQVSNSESFAKIEVDECTLTKQYVPKDAWWAAEKSGRYFWRVGYAPANWLNDQTKCKALSTTHGWSSVWSFSNPVTNISPQRSQPVDGGSNPAGIWPVLRWNATNSTLAQHGFRVQVSKSDTFSAASLIVDECRTTNSYEAITPDWTRQHNADRLFWRVNYVKNAWTDKTICKAQTVSRNTWSTVGYFKNQQPRNPTRILAPNDGATTNDGAWPLIQWTAGEYMSVPNGYRIQVHDSNSFTGTLLVDECVAGTSYIPDDIWWMIGNRGRLFYRVNYATRTWTTKSDCKTQTADAGLWSVTRSFNAGIAAAKPLLTSPSNGMSTVDGLWPSLRWNPSRSDLAKFGYRVQVSESISFSTKLVDECRTENVYTASDSNWTRNKNKTYFWRVSYANQAWNGNQTVCKSQTILPELWSDVWRFTNPQPVNPVTFSEPSNGSVFTDGGWPRLRWSNGAYMDAYVKYGYRIQISNSSSFSTQYVDQCTNDTSYMPSDIWWMIEKGGTLFYRVGYEYTNWSSNAAACDSFSQTDSRYLWSAARSFSTNISNAKPHSLSPSNGDRTTDGKWKTLSWNPARSDLAKYGYRIQVSTTSSFSNIIVDECRSSNSYTASDPNWTREKFNTHYWRVNYMKSGWSGSTSDSCKDSNKIDTRLWTATQYFVNPKPANPVVPSSPSDGYRTSGGIWPTLRWSAGSNMSYYYPHGFRIVVWRQNGSVLVDECTRGTSYLPTSNSWMQLYREYLRWRIFYVESPWSSQAACKAQGYVTSLGSTQRTFDNR